MAWRIGSESVEVYSVCVRIVSFLEVPRETEYTQGSYSSVIGLHKQRIGSIVRMELA